MAHPGRPAAACITAVITALAVAAAVGLPAGPSAAAAQSSCVDPARRLTLRGEAGQVVMASVGFDEASLAARWVHGLGVGGIAFFGTPGATVGHDVPRVRAAATGGMRPFTAVDEEGGRVQRLAALLGRIPSARQMAATMTPTALRALARTHGTGMRGLGFDVDLAPDMDVTSATGGVIGDRSFSGNPTTASAYARAFAAGLGDAGVLATGKHFPGHGHASGDSHTRSRSHLRWRSWRPTT